MAVYRNPYSQRAIDLLSRRIKNEKPFFSVSLDDVPVISKTNNPEMLESLTSYLDPEVKKVTFKIYAGLSNNNDTWIYDRKGPGELGQVAGGNHALEIVQLKNEHGLKVIELKQTIKDLNRALEEAHRRVTRRNEKIEAQKRKIEEYQRRGDENGVNYGTLAGAIIKGLLPEGSMLKKLPLLAGGSKGLGQPALPPAPSNPTQEDPGKQAWEMFYDQVAPLTDEQKIQLLSLISMLCADPEKISDLVELLT